MIVSVLTCPRPGGVSYLGGTLDAVDAELGRHRRLLVCDGCSPPEREGWTHAIVPARIGVPDNKRPGWMAIWAAFAAGESLLFLEDDARPGWPWALTELAGYRPMLGASFVSFYHPSRQPGLYPAATFDRSQAVFFPASTVEALWNAKRRNRGDWEAVIGFDLAVASLARGEGMQFEQAPNLIEHVGTVSAAAPGGCVGAPAWRRTSS